jgi:hypothetical protein
VKRIADDGNCAQRSFQDYVRDHARECDQSRAPSPRSDDDDQRGDAGNGIPYARNPSHQKIKPEADLRSWNAEHIVQYRGDMIEMFVR